MTSMDFGKRLLPHVLDHHAQTDAGRVYASIPRSTELSEGFQDVTMAAMANMTNRMSWWLDETLGSTESTTIAYIGSADLRYAIMFLAAIKCGHKMLFISPRNTIDQNQGMLDRTHCAALFYATELSKTAAALQVGRPEIRFQSVPPFVEFMNDQTKVAHYTLEKSFDDLRDEKCLILHSSGSTGNPKLISMTHGTFAVTDYDRYMPTPEGRRAQNGAQFNFDGGGRFFSCFPPYHLAGVQAFIIQPIFSTAATVVVGPASLPPSGWMLADIMKQQHLRAFYVPPFIIEQWASAPDAMKQAEQLDFILFGGGPLSPNIGDALSEVTNVCQMYGSLETGQIQLLVPQAGEWSYMELNPFEEADMQPADDGLFEMVLHQSPRLAMHRSIWHNFPHIQTWRTGDLFSPHPTKSGLWRFNSRVDDLIVLSTGHKIRPLEMETIIQGNPILSGALIVGQGKPQPLLLIEPQPGAYDGDAQTFIDRIWPSIGQANAKASSYGQLTRSKIAIASSERPFKRAPKGSIVRKLTIAEYATEIEAAFSAADAVDQGPSMEGSIEQFMLPGIKAYVKSCVSKVLPNTPVSETDNFFLSGLESLSAAELGSKLRVGLARQLSSNVTKLSLRLIYRYPTIQGLALAIIAILAGQDPEKAADQSTSLSMERAVEEFTSGLERTAEQSLPHDLPSGINVVLIGPRGSLGPYIIQSLLQDTRVSKLYCLNRGDDGRERLAASFHNRGLEFDSHDPRLSFMPVALGRPNLGLSEQHHREVTANAHIIVHNAWKVDFSLTLDSYKVELIPSVRELVEFSMKSPLRPRIVFVSSISSVQDWARIYTMPVTEAPLPSYEVVSPLGYGQSKHVSERMLVRASETCGVPVTILRVGQVAGPTAASGGRWSMDEWIPSLATNSHTLKLIPIDIPPIDWIPVNMMAQAICEAALPHPSPDAGVLRIYNLVNPCLTPWATFVGVLQNRLGPTVQLVTLTEWVTRLAATDPGSMSPAEATSATKILPFFQHLAETAAAGTTLQPRFETSKAQLASETMRNMRAVDQHLMEIWCQQWGL